MPTAAEFDAQQQREWETSEKLLEQLEQHMADYDSGRALEMAVAYALIKGTVTSYSSG